MVFIHYSISDIKDFQNISVFLFYLFPNKDISVYMFNNYAKLFKINLGNTINCHCYQTYCIDFCTILHQAQNH